jgi:hypothetical protein
MNKDLITPLIIKSPMGDDDIKFYLPNAKIIKYSELSEYKNIDELLKHNKSYCFILFEQSINSGHWVCISRNDKNIYYFDSYGGKVDNCLNFTKKEINKELKQNKKMLSELFDKSDYNIYYNPIKYQSDKKNDINSCGRHCTFFIKNFLDCDRDLNSYYNYMNQIKNESKNSYDEIVSHLIDKI